MPTEFEENVHYLKDSHGHDIEPLAEPDVEGGGGGGGGGRSGSHRRKRAWRNSRAARATAARTRATTTRRRSNEHDPSPFPLHVVVAGRVRLPH